MKIKIDVTQEDIDLGIPKSFGCPISRALTRKTGLCALALGNSAVLYESFSDVNAGSCLCIYANNPKIENFVKNFDFGYEVKPFSFYATI